MRAQLGVAIPAVLAILSGPIPAQASEYGEQPETAIIIDGQEFVRCGTPPPDASAGAEPPSDCSSNTTNPTPPEYTPGVVWQIPVVVHILMHTSGSGAVSDALVDSQILVLNEDFRAMAGTPGAPGTDVTVQYALATVDPGGNPTNGITRTTNNSWYNDQFDPALGSYWDNLAWDPHRYLNIYTNQASGALGYVPFLPANGSPGSNADRVVIYWRAFGRPGPIGPPYDQGRTATHEVGHYLGLYHTFQSGCGIAVPPGCYSTGDLICDTNPEANPQFGCPIGAMSCGFLDPIHNYMDYTDDPCYNNFTPEQTRRIRCTLIHYRPQVYSEATVALRDAAIPPAATGLAQNHPNPFNPTTELAFELVRGGEVSLVVTDVSGRAVKTLAAGTLPEGRHRFSWDGTNQENVSLASGVYFYRLETEEGSQTRRMVLVR